MRPVVLSIVLLCCSFVPAQETVTPPPAQTPQPPTPAAPAATVEQESTTPPAPSTEKESLPAPKNDKKQAPREEAWEILRLGAQNKSADRRTKSIGVLGLVPNNAEARKFAETGLQDSDPRVRAAAATALGEMGAKPSIALLEKQLDDDDTGVVLAAAKALLAMNDKAGYEVYYAVLTGERKAKGSLIHEQMKILHDKKKMAEIGIDEGLGFVPFAGMGYTAYKMLAKDEVSPVRAAAARALAQDPDPASAHALADAVGDKSWIVRKAAIDALAKRNDPNWLKAVIPAMADEKDIVMYTGAAAVIHLTDVPPRNTKRRKKK
jgi:HEAT repeat protein